MEQFTFSFLICSTDSSRLSIWILFKDANLFFFQFDQIFIYSVCMHCQAVSFRIHFFRYCVFSLIFSWINNIHTLTGLYVVGLIVDTVWGFLVFWLQIAIEPCWTVFLTERIPHTCEKFGRICHAAWKTRPNFSQLPNVFLTYLWQTRSVSVLYIARKRICHLSKKPSKKCLFFMHGFLTNVFVTYD